MTASWLSLIPPVLVLTIGLSTHHIIISLICGIASAAFIATDYSPLATIALIIESVWDKSEIWRLASWQDTIQSTNMMLILFLMGLAVMVGLIGYAGGAYAYSRAAYRYIKNSRDAETASFFLSCFLFIDDYFSCLSVGSVMRPITDQYMIPRAKLSALVNTLAAPLAILCPVSSWIAGMVEFLAKNGISSSLQGGNTLIISDPFSIYLGAIPFLFYEIAVIGGTWYFIRKRLSYGAIYLFEKQARETGNLRPARTLTVHTSRITPESNELKARLSDFFLPIASLLILALLSLPISGGYRGPLGFITLFDALQHAQAVPALFCSVIIALIGTTTLFVYRKLVPISMVIPLYGDGIVLMAPTGLMLLCAWIFGDILREHLHTGLYVGNLLTILSIPPILLPFMIFVTTVAISFAIGSSWATIAIMLPVGIPMANTILNVTTPALPEDIMILYPVLGALFSGAVAGAHLSPIADTTVMSVMSTGAHVLDHMRAQICFTIPALCGAAVACCSAGVCIQYGYWPTAIISLIIGLFITIFTMRIANFLQQRHIKKYSYDA